MIVQDLGLMPYRQAWALQEAAHGSVLAGGEEQLLIVEHPPVITFGRRAETLGRQNLVASADYLAQLGVEVVQSDRGGDITFHGPGQIVAYPIIRIKDHGLTVGSYVRRLLDIVIATLSRFEIKAHVDPAGIGVWVDQNGVGSLCCESKEIVGIETKTPAPLISGKPTKICALGVRIKRGVSLHGIALNVETDLRFFGLIVPCGIADRSVTSMRQFQGERCPPIEKVKKVLISELLDIRSSRKPEGSSPR